MAGTGELERNVALYRRYQAGRSALFTLPVFFLYFSSLVSLRELFVLEAIYYAGVVVMEVPSGWFADRVGRRPCLVIGTALGVAAHVAFAVAGGFTGLAIAQVLLAGWMAFNSGADTSLLYDSLYALGRSEELADAEARAQTAGFAAAALAAGIAGILGGFSLRILYVLTAGSQAFALAAALRMVEPPVQTTETHLGGQVRACLRRFSDRALAWSLLLVVAFTILNHVPYELYQGWLDQLLGDGEAAGSWDRTPAFSGALLMGTMLFGAAVSRTVVGLAERVGRGVALVGSVALQTGVIAVLGIWLHPVAGVAILLRSVPRAIQTPLLRALVHPRLPAQLRSTFFSILSLAGRLGFSASLFVASRLVGGDTAATWPALSATLEGFAWLGLAFTALLAILAPVALRSDPDEKRDGS